METVSISKQIKGFSNYYISDLGIVTNSKGKVIKPEDNGNGYLYVNLCQDCKVTHISVHKLLALTFCDNDNPEVNEVMHRNGNRQENTLDNLSWGTHKENMSDKLTRQRISNSQRGKVLTEEHKVNLSKALKGKGTKKVRCIELDREFSSISQAEKELGIHGTNISKCCNGKRAKAGGYSWEYCK